jgi:hypothetical protein
VAGGEKEASGPGRFTPCPGSASNPGPVLNGLLLRPFHYSDASRGALVRRYSPVIASDQLVALTGTLYAALSCHFWYEGSLEEQPC